VAHVVIDLAVEMNAGAVLPTAAPSWCVSVPICRAARAGG
jgi:hypothetical protein